MKIKILCAVLTISVTAAILPQTVIAEENEFVETARLEFDGENVFTETVNGFKWKVTGSYPTAADGMGIFDRGENKSDCTVTLPGDYVYNGTVRLQIRVKNDVSSDSDAKNGAIYFSNSGTNVLRAQIKPDGFMYFQGGTGTGDGRLDIKTINTVTDEFYTYTFDFDFDSRKISASVKNDDGEELAPAQCASFNFYKNNDLTSMDSVLISKSSSDGRLFVDYISVSKLMSEGEIAQAALDGIEIESADSIINDFALPKSGLGNAMIEWESENEQIEIEDSGEQYAAKVTTPETGSVSGILRCTVTKGETVLKKEFETTVLHVLSDAEKAEQDLDAIDIDSDFVTADIKLPVKGSINGSEISWSIEESEYAEISGDGERVIITRPAASVGSINVLLTANAELGQALASRSFSLRILKKDDVIIDDKYSKTGFVKNTANGYASVKASESGYPKIEIDDVLGEECLVFSSDIAKSEAVRVIPEYSAQKISVKTELRVDNTENSGVSEFIYDSNGLNFLRLSTSGKGVVVTHGSVDGSTTAKTTIIKEIDTGKFYTIELIFDYGSYIVSVAVDGVVVAENLPFMPTEYDPDVPGKILFGTGAGTSARLKVASLCVTANTTELTDADACAADAVSTAETVPEIITVDFDVPLSGANGTDISWSSSNETALRFMDGKAAVTRPDSAEGDKEITVTATVTRGLSSAYAEYKVKITAVSDEEAVDAALAACTLQNQNSVTGDLELPKSGLYDVSFKWHSSDPAVISDSGAVDRSQLKSDKNVALTLTGTKNSVSKEKKFNVTVKAGGSYVNGGGGGSAGGGYSSSGAGAAIPAASLSGASSIFALTQTSSDSPKPERMGFSDLAGYDWASEAIISLYERGYINGKDSGVFDPAASVLREEFATALVKVFGLYDVSAECVFSDMAKTHWSYRYVASAVKSGVVNGINDNSFGIGREITRQDMCVMLLRAMNAAGYTVKTSGEMDFSDRKEMADYAVKAVLKLAAAGVINGISDGIFAPAETANRAQMAKVIYLADAAKIEGIDDLSVPAEPVNTPEKSVSEVTGQESRLPYPDADETALKMYNTVSERKEKAMKLYYDAPSVARNTGAWSDVGYGMAALWQNDTEAGNECVIRVCTQYPPEEGSQSFESYFGMNLLMRMWYTFSDKSEIYPGRLSREAQTAIEKFFYDYVRFNSDLTTAYDIQPDRIHIRDSENHDIIQRTAFLLGSELLMMTDDYKNKDIDGLTLQEYHDAWNKYFKYYFDCKARYGLTIETGSPTYSKYTCDSMYSIYDFAMDKELKDLVGKYLDVYCADALLESLNGIRGGSRNRNYQDKYGYRPDMDAINSMFYIQFGTADYMYKNSSLHPAQLSAAASNYVAPYVLFDIMYNKTEKEPYYYESQTMGEGSRSTVGQYDQLYYEMLFPGNVYRKTYMTDNYVMSTQTIDRNLNYAEINSQNRWMGVIFKGSMRNVGAKSYDSRVYVQGIGTAQNGRTGYNELSGICENGAMVISGLTESFNSSGSRIYISGDIYSAKVIDDNWLIAEDPDGQCYVAVKPAKGEYQSVDEMEDGYFLKLSEPYAPIVIQVADKTDFSGLDAFEKAVKAATFKWSGNVFTYTSLKGDTFEVSTEKIMPKLNGEEVETAPEYLVRSPYFNSEYGSGVFNIVDTKGHEFTVDFN